jgi:signal transduction histidine kinase
MIELQEQPSRQFAEHFRRVSTALVAALTPTAIARVITAEVSTAMGARATAFALLSKEGTLFTLPIYSRYPGESIGQWHHLPNLGSLPFPNVVRTREPLFLGTRDEYSKHFPSIGDEFASYGLNASAILPLAADGRVLGALALEFSEPRTFSTEEREFLITIASQTALALDRARLFEAEQNARQAAELAADRTARLQALTAMLSGAVTPQQVSQIVLDQGMQSLGAIAGAVYLLAPLTGEQVVVAIDAPGVAQEQLDTWSTFPVNAPFPVNEAMRRCELISAASLDEYSTRWPEAAKPLVAAGYEAYMAAPLEYRGHAVGCINFNFRQRRNFTPGEKEFLLSLARLAAQAIERARLYETEHAARAEAEHANRAKSDFLAVMSHELRTPLNAISGYIDLMLAGVHGPLPDAYARYAERIQVAQKHLLGLIDSVLRFAKIEAGQITYQIATHSVTSLFNEFVPLIEPQVAAKNIMLECKACDSALTVKADSEKAIQILLNLASNAIKFTDAHGTITISAERRGDVVLLHVADTGRGIAPERVDRIFEPFMQIDTALTRDSGGVGLGLTISRDLARAMQGDLEVASTVGRGSRFTLRLPTP